MININQLDNLSVDSLVSLEAEDLKKNEVLVRLEEMGEDEQFISEPMSAREFYEALITVLEKSRDQIQNTAVAQRLEKIVVKMMWQALPALDKKTKREILNNHLLFAIENKVDVLSNLDAYLYIYEYGVGPDYEERRIFGHSLELNKETLGTGAIKLKSGEEVLPYLSNWIKDFISYSNPQSPKGASYELTQYLYSSPNVKNLTPAQKEVLAQVIRIYHNIAHPQYIPEIIGGPGKPETRPVVPLTNFEVKPPVAGTEHGASLDLLKSRLEKNQPASPIPSGIRMTPEEINREVGMEELPEHRQTEAPRPPLVRKEPAPAQPLVEKVQTISFAPKSQVLSAPLPPMAARPQPKPTPAAANTTYSINVIDDLKKLDVGYLRAGALPTQVSNLESAIANLARSNNVLPYHVVLAYEQSPLFRAYLKAGTAKIINAASPDELTQEEFEALADLRRRVEHL